MQSMNLTDTCTMYAHSTKLELPRIYLIIAIYTFHTLLNLMKAQEMEMHMVFYQMPSHANHKE